MRLRPIKIDWYIIAEIIGPFFGGFLFFSFVFLMFQLLRLAESFIVHGVSGVLLLKMAAMMVLSFTPMALPVAFLVGVMIAFGRLSSESELVAFKASGLGIRRLTAPVMGMAIVISLLSLGLNMTWGPWGDRVFRDLLLRVGNAKVVSSLKEGTFTTGFFDLLIFAEKVDRQTNQLRHVFIFDEREPKNPLTVVADRGEILNVKTESQLGTAAMLKLYSGSIHTNYAETGTYQKISFGTYRLFLKIDEETLGGGSLRPRMFSIETLLAQINGAPSSYTISDLKTEFWRRITMSFCPVIFAFLGIGFGSFRTRSIRAGASMVTLGVILIYWVSLTWASQLGIRNQLPPVIAMQIPNIIVSIMAFYAYRLARW
jgi:lipopolysaccharide export system permease protein